MFVIIFQSGNQHTLSRSEVEHLITVESVMAWKVRKDNGSQRQIIIKNTEDNTYSIVELSCQRFVLNLLLQTHGKKTVGL